MTHAPAPTESKPTGPKKPRRKTELPMTLPIKGEIILIEVMGLAELVECQSEWKSKLANVPDMELELRAINAEIRRKAK